MQSSLHRFVLATTLLLCAMPYSAAQQQAQPIGELYATDASVKGSVILAGSGTRVLSGSSIQAGAQAATLKLDRGGSLFVCEDTKLTVNASQSGRQLLLSLNTGNVELNYPLGTEADTLLTPDLQLLMPGPGTVHLAIRVSPDGDTCVQSLPWNGAAIVVSETMGDATYQVKPDEAVLFKGGHLKQATPTKQNCGCPKVVPTQVAKAAPAPGAPVPTTAASTSAGAMLPSSGQPEAAQALASAPPPDQHMSVDAPFIFHGDDAAPDLRQNVVMLKLSNTRMMNLEPTVLPPPSRNQKGAPPTQTAQNPSPPNPAKESRGFFSKVGAFFGSIFR